MTSLSSVHSITLPRVSADLLDVIEFDVLTIVSAFPDAHVIIAGDLNMLPETEIVNRTGLSPVVFQPTIEVTIDSTGSTSQIKSTAASRLSNPQLKATT